VLLELGWAGVGISWLVFFKSLTHTALFPIQLCCPRTGAAGAGLGRAKESPGWSFLNRNRSPILLRFLFSYVVLGLVLLELGWNLLAGPLQPAHPICLPFLLSYIVLDLVLLELGWVLYGRRNLLAVPF